MLGHTWRLRASNTQNQAITVTVNARYWKFASDGSITYSAEQTLLNAVSIAATTGTTASGAINNSTDKYIGMEITLSCTAAAATDSSGVVALTLERSTDSGATWPTAGQGEAIGGYLVTNADSTSTRLKNLSVS